MASTSLAHLHDDPGSGAIPSCHPPHRDTLGGSVRLPELAGQHRGGWRVSGHCRDLPLLLDRRPRVVHQDGSILSLRRSHFLPSAASSDSPG